MSFKLRGYLIILLLLVLALIVIWAPWEARRPGGIPDDLFADYEGHWQGKFWSYSISGVSSDSFYQEMTLVLVSDDSLIGVVVQFSPERDTLALDSLFNTRRGDTLYSVRRHEDGRRNVDRGFWVDGQIVWRSQDIFGRVAHAYRERVRKDLWEIDGFTRTDRGDYLLQYGRALRR
jgi:hypothetical protein